MKNWEKAKAMMNMAETIAKINNTAIERMDLNKSHLGEMEWYNLKIWYADGKTVTLRQDCTLVE